MGEPVVVVEDDDEGDTGIPLSSFLSSSFPCVPSSLVSVSVVLTLAAEAEATPLGRRAGPVVAVGDLPLGELDPFCEVEDSLFHEAWEEGMGGRVLVVGVVNKGEKGEGKGGAGENVVDVGWGIEVPAAGVVAATVETGEGGEEAPPARSTFRGDDEVFGDDDTDEDRRWRQRDAAGGGGLHRLPVPREYGE